MSRKFPPPYFPSSIRHLKRDVGPIKVALKKFKVSFSCHVALKSKFECRIIRKQYFDIWVVSYALTWRKKKETYKLGSSLVNIFLTIVILWYNIQYSYNTSMPADFNERFGDPIQRDNRTMCCTRSLRLEQTYGWGSTFYSSTLNLALLITSSWLGFLFAWSYSPVQVEYDRIKRC